MELRKEKDQGLAKDEQISFCISKTTYIVKKRALYHGYAKE